MTLDTPNGPTPEPTDRLLDIQRYLHRFDRSQSTLLVVRTYEKPSGERYTRASLGRWEGL